MRIYEIKRSIRGIVSCIVRSDGNGEILKPHKLSHMELHSPTGFECGYGGSGSADLAASILADFFNVPVRAVKRAFQKGGEGDAWKVFLYHQPFKFDVISGIHLERGESRQITSQEVVEWICKHENEEKTRAETAAGGDS